MSYRSLGGASGSAAVRRAGIGGEGHGIAFCKTTPCKVGERRRPRQRHFDRRRRFAKRSLISGGTASGTLVDWPAPPARPRSTTAASMSFSSSDGGLFASSGGTDSGATWLHRQASAPAAPRFPPRALDEKVESIVDSHHGANQIQHPHW
jgi:hypothetical protein